MKIKEEHDIIIEHHPHHESLNKKLMKDMEKVRDPKWGIPDGVRARVTDWHADSPNIDLVVSWITNILYERYPWILERGYRLFFSNRWFASYPRGECALTHAHFPFSWSWVYFVNTPKGSSPFIFTTSGKRVEAEAGKVVIFPGNVYHHVPKTRCDNRVVLAGNINWGA